MAQAIIKGLLETGTAAANICASEYTQEMAEAASQKLGIKTSTSNTEVIRDADVVVLAVKPQVLESVCSEIRESLSASTLIISIAAGIDCHALETWLGDHAIVRCMPNTPAAIGQGASGIFCNAQVNNTQAQLAEHILAAIGLVLRVKEEQQIDAVTAVSGSGPAYFFLFIEAMADAGKQLGLDYDTALQLAKQTAVGAASLANSSELDIATLRKNVTSPKGTTEQAILSFEANKLRDIVLDAMQACANRAKTLSEELGPK